MTTGLFALLAVMMLLSEPANDLLGTIVHIEAWVLLAVCGLTVVVRGITALVERR